MDGPTRWLLSLGVVGDIVLVAMVVTIAVYLVLTLWLIIATTLWLRRNSS